MVVSLQSRNHKHYHPSFKNVVEFYENDTKQLFSLYIRQLIPASRPLGYHERLCDENFLVQKTGIIFSLPLTSQNYCTHSMQFEEKVLYNYGMLLLLPLVVL